MKSKVKLSTTLFSLILITSCVINKKGGKGEKIQILSIDKNVLEFHYLIKATLKDRAILIISKKLNKSIHCKKQIAEGKKYFFVLEEKNQIQIDSNLTIRVDGRGIYMEGEKIFNENEKVFTSPMLSGLCLSPK